MQFPEQWLRALVDPPLATDALARLLTMSGLEVESSVSVAPPFTGVVVGRVLSVGKHPNADKLTVCRVDVGSGQPLAIVCGAPNVVAGMKAPCTLVGARLPGTSADQQFEIKAASMRGVESQGMLCSARELGLSEDHGGLLVITTDVEPGIDVRKALALDDQILTIKLTPNRADCLSVLGVARVVAELTATALSPPDTLPVPAANSARFPVRISDPNGCGRFTGRV